MVSKVVKSVKAGTLGGKKQWRPRDLRQFVSSRSKLGKRKFSDPSFKRRMK